jgi:hypothetical protein
MRGHAHLMAKQREEREKEEEEAEESWREVWVNSTLPLLNLELKG